MLGQVIHGYRVDRVLSADKGGFGEVFLATHMESGAEAVVKVLRAEMSANHDTVTRFFNEARAAASIHHPGIVAIHNVGYHGDRAYLLMERLRGDDLQTRLEAGPLPLDRALVFMRQTAGAIAAAHERGIVHRDLKPANLFIVTDPDVIGGERVKVLDFGIAKLGGGGGNPGATQGVFGTPMYMSPEQCANTGAVDHRSDLYSLGCIFYELATGRPPFGRGGIELIAAHLRDAPVPPRAINPAVPPAIEALILSLLEKDPARRLQSCAALSRALEGAASQAGISLGAAQSQPPVTGGSATLGSAASAMQAATKTLAQPTPKRRVWIALAVVGGVAAAAAVTVVIAAGDSSSTSTSMSPAKAPPRDAGIAVAAFADAVPAPQDARPYEEQAARAAAESFFEHGVEAMKAGKDELPIAANYFEQAIVNHPTAAAYYDLGVVSYRQGNFGMALMSLEAVTKNHPTEEEGKKAADAIEVVKKEMRKQGLDPDHVLPPTTAKPSKATPRSQLSPAEEDALAAKDFAEGKKFLFSQPGEYEKAAAKFRATIALRPSAMEYFSLGLAEYQQGHFGEAIRALHSVASYNPTTREIGITKDLLAKVKEQMVKQGMTPPPD